MFHAKILEPIYELEFNLLSYPHCVLKSLWEHFVQFPRVFVRVGANLSDPNI